MIRVIIAYVLLCTVVSSSVAKTVLVYGGKTGWIGQELIHVFTNEGYNAVAGSVRIEDREAVLSEIDSIKPDYIINAAGLTGRPNVDWCEDHKEQVMRANVIGLLNLVDCAYLRGIHITNIHTGCIYTWIGASPEQLANGFTEEDPPNFSGSFYSATKVLGEKLMMVYPNVLNLRMSKPVSSSLYERSFVGKIVRHQNVIDAPNSVCVLEDLLPLVPRMLEKGLTGIYNFVNPGTVTHVQIKELYKKYLDGSHTYGIFSEKEQNRLMRVPRANAYLSSKKLTAIFPDVPTAYDSLNKIFTRLATQQEEGNKHHV